MTKWQQHRQVMIALTFGGALVTVGIFSLDSSAGNRSVTPFSFPEIVPLPEWQLVESRLLPDYAASSESHELVSASHKYLYIGNERQLEIEMRYMVGTLGELHGYFKDYTSIKLEHAQLLQNLRQQEGVGFYSLFVHQGRSHLTACINPRGSSTVSTVQFLANHHTYDLQLPRLLPWLLGKESLRDRRCLWTDLSTPLNQNSAESTYLVLERAWLHWYQWWHRRFPQH